jgi:hypothetical protein
MAAVLVLPSIFYEREVAPIAWQQLMPGPHGPSDEANTLLQSKPVEADVQAPLLSDSTAERLPPMAGGTSEDLGLSGGEYATGSPFDQLAMSWTANDAPLFNGSYYVETMPLLESVSRGLKPLTETMGSAITIIKDSTIPGGQSMAPAGPPQAAHPTNSHSDLTFLV